MAFFLAIYAETSGEPPQRSCCTDARIREKKNLRITKLEQEKEPKQPFFHLLLALSSSASCCGAFEEI
jgi:hypothetical protein